MIAAIARTAATPPRESTSGPPGKVFSFWRTDFLAAPAGSSAPQAFLVEMPRPGAVIPPHFHVEDEFQVVVAGNGQLGKHALEAVAAHFVDAYTPYGPIRVGSEGLTFFTLRAQADPGALYMPESRAMLTRKARRNVAAHVSPEGEIAVVLPAHDDGLGAWVARAEPGADIVSPSGDGGRYYLVLEGAVTHATTELARWSCVWAGPGTPRPRLVAGPAGADVLVVQFPSLPLHR